MKKMTKTGIASAMLLAGMGTAAADIAESKGGITVRTEDGRFESSVEGRIMLDFAAFDNSDIAGAGENVGGTEFRRVRFGVAGTLFGWEYKLEPDFADDGVSFKDLYIATKVGPGKLYLGQFKQFFSIEELTSSRYITFQERSFLTQSLSTSHQVGIGFQGNADALTYGVSVYNIDTNDAESNESIGFGGRLTFAPINEDGRTLHLGAAAARESVGVSNTPDTDDNERVRSRVRVAGHMSDASRPTLIDLNNGERVETIKYGLEAAAVFGPFSLQAEYGMGDFEDNTEEAELSSYNVFASYFLTGESRPYDAKKGRFGQIKPKSKSGALEIAIRFDSATGEENPLNAGLSRDIEATALTFGVNWYPNPNVRFMLNYIDAEIENNLASMKTDDPSAITGRVQIHF